MQVAVITYRFIHYVKLIYFHITVSAAFSRTLLAPRTFKPSPLTSTMMYSSTLNRTTSNMQPLPSYLFYHYNTDISLPNHHIDTNSIGDMTVGNTIGDSINSIASIGHINTDGNIMGYQPDVSCSSLLKKRKKKMNKHKYKKRRKRDKFKRRNLDNIKERKRRTREKADERLKQALV